MGKSMKIKNSQTHTIFCNFIPKDEKTFRNLDSHFFVYIHLTQSPNILLNLCTKLVFCAQGIFLTIFFINLFAAIGSA